jgi:C-terminal processing protease CtpA/Prc
MKKLLLTIFIAVIILTGGVFAVSKYVKNTSLQTAGTTITPISDKYLAFTYEVWDKIKSNYWEKISDEDLAKIYKLAADKALGKTAPIDSKTKDQVGELVTTAIKDMSEDKKKEFVTQVADLVLANLKPFGRSRLYTSKQQEDLSKTVMNVDTSTDLYSVLDLQKGASTEDVKKSYEQKTAELKKDRSSDAVQKLATIQRAFDALSKTETKQTYDRSGVEPTVTYKLLAPDIFYIKLSKFSPQSFEELKKAADSIDTKMKNGPTALIFDLRGNVGGAIDILQYFLGPFIGPDNYAYDFYHQDEKTPYKTKFGWFDSLVRYKKVVTLIDGQDQSSAEVMAATLKKYNVGVVVGTKTKGWGTVEQVTPLTNQLDDKEKFSVFMVHSITLREDGQPIEGRGVEPTINVGDKNWEQQLMSYYNYQPLVDAVKKLVEK